jgi:hypothetical protein
MHDTPFPLPNAVDIHEWGIGRELTFEPPGVLMGEMVAAS